MARLGGVGPYNRKGRLSLTTERPRESSLGGERPDPTIIPDPVQRWGAALWSARNTWDIDRRRLPDDVNAWSRGGNLLGGRRLDRADADKLLRLGVAAISRGEVAL